MARFPPPTYHCRTEFEVPLSYAFAWCTDYRPDDSRRSKEEFERRIVRRGRRRIIYEDMWRDGPGWGWRRQVVDLHPPGRWHAESYGSFRTASIEYLLKELPGGRTQFDLYMKRRPSEAFPTQPTRAALERELRKMWTNYGRAMAKDYRDSQKAPRRARRS